MSELWKIVQAHLDQYGVSEAEFARRMGSRPQTLNSWKKRGLKQLPERRLLEAVSEHTGTKYDEVLAAALVDIAYMERLPSPLSRRTHHGAWELDQGVLADLSMLADEVDQYADTASLVDDGDDIEEVVTAANDLAAISFDLVKAAQNVAEVGVGGRVHLRLLKARLRKERAAAERVDRANVLHDARLRDEYELETIAARAGETEYEIRQKNEPQAEDENQDNGSDEPA